MKNIPVTLFVAALLLGLGGCASTSRSTRTVERGSLSEAMHKASRSERKERKVADSHEERERSWGSFHWGSHHSHHDHDDDIVIVQVDDDEERQEETSGAPFAPPENRFFALRASSAACYSKEYERMYGGSIMIAAENHGSRHGLEIGGAKVPPTLFGDSHDALDDLFRINAGYQYRHMLAPNAIALQPFLLAGGGLTSLVWSYRNAIESDVIDEWGNRTRTDVISHDGLIGISGEAGFGMKLLNTSTLGISMESALGVTGYSDETFEAFHNDIFAGDFYGRFGFEIAFGNAE